MNPSIFQFKNPILEKVEFMLNDEFEKESFEGFAIKDKITTKNIEEGKKANVTLEIMIGEENTNTPFRIHIVMSSVFYSETLAKEKFEELLVTNAPAALLSYIRPIISSLTSQSGYPTLTIPFMSFSAKDKII